MQDHHEPRGREWLLTLLCSAVALGLIGLAGNASPDLFLALIQRF
ncbi:hypothetical protein N7403_09805 [Pseudomonas nitroreducens]|nr:hypothetical protein [Pseudomonas nitroreducens]MDG9854145.1 hypothetical protein [Pseudomonas nitroreducens]